MKEAGKEIPKFMGLEKAPARESREVKREYEFLKREARKRMADLRKAREFNYEIFNSLVDLSDEARSFLGISSQSPKQADAFKRKTIVLLESLIKMELLIQKGSMGNLHASGSRDQKGTPVCSKIEEDFLKSVDDISNLARFGYGTPDLLREGDLGQNRVDISEEGLKKLSPAVRKSWINFWERTISDKGFTELKMGEVSSFHEAVRFLHHQIFVSLRQLAREFEPYKNFDKLYLQHNGVQRGSLRVINLGEEELKDQELAVLTEEFLKTIPTNSLDNFNSGVFIFSDDCLEATFPIGQHKLEIQSYVNKRNEGEKDHITVFRSIEPSDYRIDLLKQILEEQAFGIELREDSITAIGRTSSDQAGKENLTTALKLVASVYDLDIHCKSSQDVSTAIEAYKKDIVLLADYLSFKKEYEYLSSISFLGPDQMLDLEVSMDGLIEGGMPEKKALIGFLGNKNSLSFSKNLLGHFDISQLRRLSKVVKDLKKQEKIEEESRDKIDNVEKLLESII